MTNRTIKILKPVVFLVAIFPFFGFVMAARTGNLGADPVQSLTHWTGDWTLWTLLASLAITPVRRLSPRLAWLIRFRRMLGLFAFFYGTLHLMTYVFLFSGFDLSGALDALRSGQLHVIGEDWSAVWPTVHDDLVKRRFVQVGLLAYAILLALAVTSPQAIIRKMGGKPWQTLHRMVYAAGILGVFHFWWSVKKGVMRPLPVTLILLVILLARPAYLLLKKKPMTPVAADL